MPMPDLEFWNRRSSVAAIAHELRWALAHVWSQAPVQAMGTVVVHVLMGIQPAILIHITRNLVDTVVEVAGGGAAGFADVMPWLIAFGLTLLLTNEVFWNVRDTLQLRLEQRLSHTLGHLYLGKSSRLPLISFDVSEYHDRLQRAKDPGRKVQRLFFTSMHFFQALISAVTVSAMFAPVSPWMSLALLCVLVPQIRLEIEQSRKFMAFTYGETEEERRAGYVDRLLTGRDEQKEMRLFRLHGPLTGRWRVMRQVLRERLLDQRHRQAIGGLPVTGLRIAVSVGVAAVLAYLLGDRVLSPGRFVALFQGVDDMLRAGSSLGYSARQLQAESTEVGYVRGFLSLTADDIAPANAPQGEAGGVAFPRPLRGGLIAEDIWFAYPAADPSTTDESDVRPVLQGVSFHLEPGERVALVGANGSGKSTLAKILLGLYPPTSGRMVADGIGYSEIEQDSLASAVSAAFQDFCRLELTLEQSIGIAALGPADGPAADLWPEWLRPDGAIVEDAARRSGADSIAERLPQGYRTPVGHVLDGGQGLSGGEWQRLAIARAFTQDAELLVLDEPAAALDPMAEAELYRQFAELLEGRTAMLISHRLGSARMADRILVLRHGRIVEAGHHDDLLRSGGVYAAMWEEQASWYR